MRWERNSLPWVTRPAGDRPSTPAERFAAVRHALLDLPRAMREDSTAEMAAGMTFFLLFSLFPGLVFLVTFLPLLPTELANVEILFDTLQPLMPAEVHDLLHSQFVSVLTQPRSGLAIVSATVALYSASRALVSLSRALNRSYRVQRWKPEWRRRLRSMGLTLGVFLLLVLTIALLTLGDVIIRWLMANDMLPIGPGTAIIIARYPLLLVVLSFLVQQLYYLLPDARGRWRPFSAGSVFAMISWGVATAILTGVARSFIEANFAYGALGSIAVVMSWLYIGCFLIIVGATFNALIDRGLPPAEREFDADAEVRPGDETDAE